MENSIGNIMDVTMTKLREMVDVNTVIGDPITTPDGITLIPISRVSVGFASGGVDTEKGKSEENSINFGGGSGAGASIIPVAFLLISNDTVKFIPVSAPASTTVDRVVEIIPQLIDRVEYLFKPQKTE